MSAEALLAGPMAGVPWSANSWGAWLHGARAEAAQRALVELFHPALAARYGERAVRAAAGWPGASLGEAAALLAAYCLLLVIGVSRARARAGPLLSDGALRPAMVAYNGAQVALSSVLAASAAALALRRGLAFACNGYALDGDAAMPALVWLFAASKVVDFADTALIVARAKWAQLSFLHCYHHATIFVMFWLVLVAGAQGDVFFTVLINSTVHALMYLYYLLASLGVRPAWGRYLTQFQIAQFVLMNTQALLIFAGGCAYPTRMNALYLAYCASLLVLFAWFYVEKHLWRRSGDDGLPPRKQRGADKTD